jgi:hypothetical protein
MNDPESLFRHSKDRERELLEEGGRMRAAAEARRHHSRAGLLGSFLRRLAGAVDPAGIQRDRRL